MKKKKKSKKLVFDAPKHLPVITSVLVIVLSALLFFFAKGYTVDLENRAVNKRGVITVNSRPIQAEIYINNEMIGKGSKSRAVDTGAHNVVLRREKYHTWEKDVRVLPETTTIITPWMLLKKPGKYTAWDSKKPYVAHWVSNDGNIALLLLQEDDGVYELWRYKLQSGLLDIFDNPNKIWTSESKDIDLLLSPNGSYALLTLSNSDGRDGKEKHLINTSSQFSLVSSRPLDLGEKNGFEIAWAKDNKHLILTSQESILSYNINSQLTYSMLSQEGDKQSIWRTDKNGNFYTLVDLSKPDDPVYTYSIERQGLDGTGDSYLISNISLQKDEKYIEYYRENLFNYIPFTNSPINTQSVGKITDFEVNLDIAGIFITTTAASYWYDTDSGTYVMVNPYPSELLEFSKNNRHFLFNSNNSLYTFTFRKYSENPVEKTGSTQFMNAKKEDQIAWVDNSNYYSYIKEDYLNIAEKDGDNEFKILPIKEILFYSIEGSKNNITTLEVDSKGNLVINQYRIQ